MESDLLKKEDEFYKENEKLEQRTKELMKKVTDVMNLDFNQIDQQLIIPNGVEEMGIKGANQYYKAKVKTLQVEVVKLQAENRKKNEELKKLQKENQSFHEEKDKWFASYSSAKNTIGKLESQVSSLNTKFQGKITELSSVKKELEQTKKDLKSSNLNLNNFEVRLTRAQEENEKLKHLLKSAKDEEKDMRESFKKQINDLTTTVKHIEKHKVELLNGFKKQLQLIDNLKKQKLYLESIKIGELSESEYMKILDWKWD